MNKKKEVEEEWEGMGKFPEVNSANPIGQLEALRFKMKSEKCQIIEFGKGRDFGK